MYKYLNQFFFYRLSVLIGVTLSLLNLLGCKDSSTASSSLNTQSTVDVVEASPFIETRSDFVTVEPNIQEFVDIRQFISSKSDIVIDDIKVDTVSQHEGQPMMRMTGVCNAPVVELNGDKLGFYVQLDSRNLCSYRYKVSGQSLSTGHRVESQFSTLNFFATTDKDPKLEIISKHGLLSDEHDSQTINIDLADYFTINWDDWELSEQYTLLGDGDVKLFQNSIKFSYRVAGYARILYTLTNTKNLSEAKLGQIDISIGENLPNGLIIEEINDFNYKSSSKGILDIDISKLISIQNNIEYQLVNVYSVDGSAFIRSKHLNDPYNKFFTFTRNSQSPKYLDVTFVLSNHKGSFKTGILTLVMTDIDPICDSNSGTVSNCIDIVDIGGGKLFTSPPSKTFLDSLGFSQFAENQLSTSESNSFFYTFDLSSAQALCKTYNSKRLGGRTNWRLPLDYDFSELKNSSLSGNSLADWNHDKQYWVFNNYNKNKNVNFFGDWLVSPNTSAKNTSNQFYVSCVSFREEFSIYTTQDIMFPELNEQNDLTHSQTGPNFRFLFKGSLNEVSNKDRFFKIYIAKFGIYGYRDIVYPSNQLCKVLANQPVHCIFLSTGTVYGQLYRWVIVELFDDQQVSSIVSRQISAVPQRL
ncbi:hypothetical protein BS333_13740 [Vibrio azureus]|uniref:DUF1566 domain-containing protein n=3 Tax=Vibrio azureus TaxID=512649 RepID=U3AU59_9VIBR|nr:hypothetical protein [Vibrio azureus]AUI87480.1 hypothetical protein BS333_13740 [Vibrio azureus]GAD77280.1 hypothetical protein VAZ01S_069_00280 [Vibrio azureus NBRC 104587]